jgi:hypothetical protein
MRSPSHHDTSVGIDLLMSQEQHLRIQSPWSIEQTLEQVTLLQQSTPRTLVRQRIDLFCRANSGTSNVQHLAIFYGITRMSAVPRASSPINQSNRSYKAILWCGKSQVNLLRLWLGLGFLLRNFHDGICHLNSLFVNELVTTMLLSPTTPSPLTAHQMIAQRLR